MAQKILICCVRVTPVPAVASRLLPPPLPPPPFLFPFASSPAPSPVAPSPALACKPYKRHPSPTPNLPQRLPLIDRPPPLFNSPARAVRSAVRLPMEMVVLQQRAAAGSSNAGARPAAATAPMVAVSSSAKQEQEEMNKEAAGSAADAELRRGPWTVDEDLALINYISEHGEGRWNALARAAGLNRTGKSCRLRWLNYLRPDVKRGDFTADEQLLILDLHSRWENRWSKIAAQLPGRTDNEIKNYWRTRVQKHAKQLNCDVNSKRFKDAMRFLWMPRLAERAAQSAEPHHQAAAAAVSGCFEMTGTTNAAADRSPSSVVTTTSSTSPCSSSRTTSSGSTATVNDDYYYYKGAAAPGPGGDDWAAAIQQDHEFWSTASNLQQLVFPPADLPMQEQDLSGWVQGFSDSVGGAPETHHQLWSLDDIWRMH